MQQKSHTRIPGLGTQVPDSGRWTLDSRLWTLDSGHCCRLVQNRIKTQFLILIGHIIENSLDANL